MASKITYDDLVDNDRFVASAYRSLVALGETPSQRPKEIVDDFLSKTRFFENNLISTLSVSSSVKRMSSQQKEEFGAALSMVGELPNFHEQGGAPAFDAVKDHLLSVLGDPTNVLGAFAGMASFGVGGAAALGVKETAKQTTKNYLKAKLRASIAPAILESTVTGAGSSFRNIKKQQTEIEVGNRANINISEAALVGAIEGPASVVAGGLLSAGLGAGIRTLDKTIGDTGAARWFVRNMLPRDVGKEWEIRIAETHASQSKSYNRTAGELGENLENALLRSVEEGTFKNIKEAREFANKILVPDKKKLRQAGFKKWGSGVDSSPWFNLKELAEAPISSELRQTLGDAQNFIKELQEYAQTTPYVQKKFREIFDPMQNYARDIYEVFSVSKRSQGFDDFIKGTLLDGTDVISDLLAHARNSPEWVAKTIEDLDLTFLKVGGRKEAVNESKLIAALNGPDGMEWADSLARKMYEPTQGRGFKLQGNVDEARKVIPEFQKLIWGKNYSPSQRLIWSVAGIVDSLDRLKFGADLADSLISRNKAVKARSRAEAYTQLNEAAVAAGKKEGILQSDVIRVVGNRNGKYDALVEVEPNRLTSAGENVWMTRAEAERLAPAVSPFLNRNRFDTPFLHSAIANPIARIQGTFKLGKTVYNPIAHMRNALGAAQAFVGSGAWVRARKEMQAIAKMSKAERSQLIEDMHRSGITSTSVELEQILTRLGREITEDPGRIEKIGTFGLAGTKTGKAAMKLYQGTDNIAKMATYLSELGAEKALWKTLTDQQKLIKRQALNKGFGRGAASGRKSGIVRDSEGTVTQVQRGGFSEEQAIAELAARNTLNIMPVYSRVPLALEKMAGVPIIGNFSAYPAEVYRNAWNIFRLGAKEMEEGYSLGNKSLVAKGGQRMLSMYGMASAPFALSYTVNNLRGDEQRVESLREFLPDYHRYGAIVINKFDFKKGDIEYSTLDYSNPYQPLTAIIAPVMQGIAQGIPADELLREQGLVAARSFVSPFTDPSLALQGSSAFFNMVTNLTDPSYREGEFARDARTFYRSALPSFVKLTGDATRAVGAMPEAIERIMYPKAFGEYKQPPKDISELGSILEKQGFNSGALKSHKINLKTSSGYVLSHLNRNADAYWKNFYNTLKDSLRDPSVELDPGSLLEDYEEVLRIQYASQQGMAKLYVDLRNIMGKGAAKQIFFDKDLKGVVPSKKALATLTSDRPLTNLKRLSTNKTLWKSIERSRRGANVSAWRTELARIERKYNFKNAFEDPIE